MLRETFVHIPGVGYRTEERLWRKGIRTWDDFSVASKPHRVPARVLRRIGDEIVRSDEALRRGRHRYFARNLPPRDHWRAWPEFAKAIAYLDIETTGLSIGRDAVTVVGVFDGTRRRSFIQGDNLEDLPAAMERAKLLVTFNGSRFDVPFLRKAFPRMALDQIHLDLVHPLRRLGFVGGLKAIESQVGILRSEETTGLGGFDAVRLWHAYEPPPRIQHGGRRQLGAARRAGVRRLAVALLGRRVRYGGSPSESNWPALARGSEKI